MKPLKMLGYVFLAPQKNLTQPTKRTEVRPTNMINTRLKVKPPKTSLGKHH